MMGRLNAALFFAQTRQCPRHAKPVLIFLELKLNRDMIQKRFSSYTDKLNRRIK
jgi:hypothetical protein